MPGIEFLRDSSLSFMEMKRCDDKSLSYKKHFHEEYSLGLIEQGASQVWCNGKDIEVPAGRCLLMPPYLPHSCNPTEGSAWSYLMFFFRAEWVEGMLGGEASLTEPALLEGKPNRSCTAEMKRLVHGMRSGVSPLELETWAIGLVKTAFAEASKSCGHILMQRTPVRVAAGAHPLLQDVKAYLHEHFAERVTLEELEAIAGLNRFHLIHAFKKEFKLPPHAYQNLLRINHAKKELARGRSIADVALEAGFYDQSHFTKCFKSFSGVTPQKYIHAL